MKKVKAPRPKSNVVSTKPFPSTPNPRPPFSGPTSFAGPGVNVPRNPKNYKKGRGG